MSSSHTTQPNSWDQRFDQLKTFVETNGRLPQMDSTFYSEKILACWCCRQKRKWKNDSLRNERILKLESIKGWFWIIDIKGYWNEKFNKFQKYIIKSPREVGR